MEIWQSPIQYGQNHGLSWPALLLVVVWLVVCVPLCMHPVCFVFFPHCMWTRGEGGITAMWQTHVWAVCSLCFNSRLCHARSRPLLPLSPSVSSFSALRHLLRSSFHLVLLFSLPVAGLSSDTTGSQDRSTGCTQLSSHGHGCAFPHMHAMFFSNWDANKL